MLFVEVPALKLRFKENGYGLGGHLVVSGEVNSPGRFDEPVRLYCNYTVPVFHINKKLFHAVHSIKIHSCALPT